MGGIKINIVRFDGSAIDDDELSYKSHQTPLGILVEHIATSIGSIEELSNLKFKMRAEIAQDLGLPTHPEEDIEIDVVLVDNSEVADCWNAPDGSLGFHAINAGAYEYDDGDVLSCRHRVVVIVDEEALRKHMAEERAMEMNPHSDAHDREYLFAYLATITHEVAHCVEFIEHGNGLTPSEIGNLIDSGDIPYDMSDICSGHGAIIEFDANASREHLESVMEERVEEKGVDWLLKLRLDEGLVMRAVSAYAPKGRKREVDLDGNDLGSC